MIGHGSYDGFKLRSDLDERPEADEREGCDTCGQLDGSHDAQCPERGGFGEWVDAEIDRVKEGD